VEWNVNGSRMEGVYVPRRDTSSRLNSFFGGRLFPGEQHHARFHVREGNDGFNVIVDSDDGDAHISVAGRLTETLPKTSVFTSLREASEFFESDTVGYSATSDPLRYDGLELRCKNWSVLPLDVTQVKSSYFDNRELFPPGTAIFDCALLMR